MDRRCIGEIVLDGAGAALPCTMQNIYDARILLAGDFNCLDGDKLVSRCALNPIVDQPTRGANRLDQIMSAISHMTVLKSLRRPLRATTRISSPPRVQHHATSTRQEKSACLEDARRPSTHSSLNICRRCRLNWQKMRRCRATLTGCTTLCRRCWTATIRKEKSPLRRPTRASSHRPLNHSCTGRTA